MADRNLALNLLIKAKDAASATVRRFTQEVEDSGKAAEQLDRSLDQVDDKVVQFDRSSDKAGESVGHFSDQLSEADKAAGRYYDQAGRLHEANGRFATGAKRAGAEADQFGDQLKQNAKDADQLGGKLGGLTNRIKGLFVGGAVTAFLGNLFGSALRSSAEFERQMNRVEAVTGATAEEMRQLTAAAEEAGSTTEFTSAQAGEGLEILARAGFNARQSIELLPSVLSVATAEGVSLAEAAGLVSDTLSVMQMEIDQGAKATDVLARGSSLANTKMLDLGNAISYTGAFAREADLDLEQLVAVLDVLAKNSLRGERAGTGLRAILAQLSDPASKASKAIKELGLPTDNFIQLIEGLRQKGPEATKAINAFGIEAGPALRALIAEGAAGIKLFEDQLRNADGAAKKMSDTVSDDLTGSARGFQSAWDSLRRTLSDPSLAPLAGLLDQLAAKFREMKEAGNLRVWGEITAVAINRVAGGLQMLYNTATLAVKSIGTFVAAVTFEMARTELALAKILNRVGVVADETVKKLEIEVGALGDVVEQLVAEAGQDLADIGDGWDLLSGKVTLGQQKIAEATAAAGEQAKNAANAASTAAGDVAAAGDQAASALDIAAQKIIDTFNTVQDEGKTTADAIATTFGEVDLSTAEGVAALGTAMEQMAEGAEGLSAKLQEGLVKTLEKMTVDQLEAFRLKAIEAFADAEGGASKLDRLLNGALDASLRTLGIDIEKLRTGITTVGGNAIQAFDIVRDELKRTGTAGKQASDTIEAAFDAAFDKVTTKAGLDKLKASLRAAAQDGLISWAEYRAELQRIQDKYADLAQAAKQSITGQKTALSGLKSEARMAARAIESSGSATAYRNLATSEGVALEDQLTRTSRRQLLLAGKSKAEWDEMSETMGERYTELTEQMQESLRNIKARSAIGYRNAYSRIWDYTQKLADREMDAFLLQQQRGGDTAATSAAAASAAPAVSPLSSTAQQRQVQPLPTEVVTVKFDFNGQQIPGTFAQSDVGALLDQLASVARVSR